MTAWGAGFGRHWATNAVKKKGIQKFNQRRGEGAEDAPHLGCRLVMAGHGLPSPGILIVLFGLSMLPLNPHSALVPTAPPPVGSYSSHRTSLEREPSFFPSSFQATLYAALAASF